MILLSVVTEPRPHVAAGERIEIRPLGHPDDGIVQVIVRAGYKDRLDVPASLRLAAARGLGVDVGDPSYYASRSVLTATSDPGLRRWRKRLFMALTRLAADPVAYFGLPDDRVVILGSRVRL